MRKDLKTTYKEQIVPHLISTFKYKNIEQVPKILKISVNRGLGEGSRNSKELEASVQELATVSGQKPIVNEAKKIYCWL